jgi:riboflavin kinase
LILLGINLPKYFVAKMAGSQLNRCCCPAAARPPCLQIFAKNQLHTRIMNKQLPIRIISKVVRGYGRGSKDLGIPTANVSREKEDLYCSCGDFDHLPTGIYWGFACIGDGEGVGVGEKNDDDNAVLGKVHTAAISIGYNPTYNNNELTVEPHLIAAATHPQRHASSTGETLFGDFYGKTIVLSVVGYLRPELPFEGLEKLTDAIKKDIADAEALAGQSNSTTLAERDWVGSSLLLNGGGVTT